MPSSQLPELIYGSGQASRRLRMLISGFDLPTYDAWGEREKLVLALTIQAHSAQEISDLMCQMEDTRFHMSRATVYNILRSPRCQEELAKLRDGAHDHLKALIPKAMEKLGGLLDNADPAIRIQAIREVRQWDYAEEEAGNNQSAGELVKEVMAFARESLGEVASAHKVANRQAEYAEKLLTSRAKSHGVDITELPPNSMGALVDIPKLKEIQDEG